MPRLRARRRDNGHRRYLPEVGIGIIADQDAVALLATFEVMGHATIYRWGTGDESASSQETARVSVRQGLACLQFRRRPR